MKKLKIYKYIKIPLKLAKYARINAESHSLYIKILSWYLNTWQVVFYEKQLTQYEATAFFTTNTWHYGFNIG